MDDNNIQKLAELENPVKAKRKTSPASEPSIAQQQLNVLRDISIWGQSNAEAIAQMRQEYQRNADRIRDDNREHTLRADGNSERTRRIFNTLTAVSAVRLIVEFGILVALVLTWFAP